MSDPEEVVSELFISFAKIQFWMNKKLLCY